MKAVAEGNVAKLFLSKEGGVTVGEAKALDEAAEMVEARRLPPEALPSARPAETASPAR